MKYLSICEWKNDDMDVNEFETENEAKEDAKKYAARTTALTRKHIRKIYVLESTNPNEFAPDHYDGYIIAEY